MYKLIWSNHKQLGRVYSNGLIVWEIESIENGLKMFERYVYFTNFGVITNMRGLPGKNEFDYFEHRGVRINSSDINRISSSLSRVRNSNLADVMRANYEYGIDIKIKFYKRVPQTQAIPSQPEPPVVETQPEPQPIPEPEIERPSRKAFETKRVEVFNAGSYISITGIGRDWSAFEIEGVEVIQSDGVSYYNDFTVHNSDKVQAIQTATGLRSYNLGNFNVRKFRGGKLTPVIKGFAYPISSLKEVA